MPTLPFLIKHQAGAAAATLFDFATMSLLVEASLLQPELATAVGALCGAVLNFMLGRSWIFVAQKDHGPGTIFGEQVARYALVAGMSLAWNTVGVALLFRGLGLQYFLARVLVALVVSLSWNYPMHRWFVFRAGIRQSSA